MAMPSLKPCAEANPVLWRLFCNVTGRQHDDAPHWTEQDVYNWALDWIVRGRVAETTIRIEAPTPSAVNSKGGQK